MLQSAPLAGRDTELQRLLEALTNAMGGKGSAWLIGGESGIGKSRLLDELRTQALVRGNMVLRGQAVSEGSSPFEVWRNVLRWLILLTDLSDQEASVLKNLISDIDTLIERPVVEAAALDPKAAQLRLFSVISDILRRQQQPLSIMLEDLHWAGDESLDLLRWLLRTTHEMPVLMLGNYRDDEKPDLPQQLAGMQLLKLKRLSAENIAQISELMLGAAAAQPEVVNLLERETEGNVYFLVEVVRALAEEVGQLDKIGTITLPAHVVSGGIKRLVQRRLERVPAEDRPLLELAAIAGRQLDLALLRTTKMVSDVEQWLTACVNAAVIDVQEGRWRFAHDKLREGLLTNLSPEMSRDLHQRVATAMETVYANSAIHWAALAEHWASAGDTEKARHYSLLAGEEALRNGAHRQAINFLNKALTMS